MAVMAHLMTLQQGAIVWSAWRSCYPTIDPDLSDADLDEVELRGANLQRANFNRSSLCWAVLNEADLSAAKVQ